MLERLQTLVERSPRCVHAVDEALRALNGRPGDVSSFDALHELLEAQAYRLAFWRVSGEEINYRRFFDINDLVGLRMENPRVFAETHKLIRKLLGEGLISGIAHRSSGWPAESVAILLPAANALCRQPMLRRRAGAATGRRRDRAGSAERFRQQPRMNQQAPLYLLVEKFWSRERSLPLWPVDGTVGYDFANLVNGILIDRRNERQFTKLYQRVIGGSVRR